MTKNQRINEIDSILGIDRSKDKRPQKEWMPADYERIIFSVTELFSTRAYDDGNVYFPISMLRSIKHRLMDDIDDRIMELKLLDKK